MRRNIFIINRALMSIILYSFLLSDKNAKTTEQKIEVKSSELPCRNYENGNKIETSNSRLKSKGCF